MYSGTSTIGYSVLLNLLAHPAARAEIKDEIQRVKENELGGSSVWTRHSLGELRLLDSFMRETLRVNPFTEGRPFTFAITWRFMKPLTNLDFT